MKQKKSRLVIILSIIFVLFIFLIIWIIWGNTALKLNKYTFWCDNVTDSLDGFRIAHISDLHNASFGDENEKLLDMIKESEPEIIAITGDIVDSRNTDIDVALKFAEKALEIAPCYYVSGNHESRIPEYDKLKTGLSELGVEVLENKSVEIEHNDGKILLIGVDDPSFQTDYLLGDSQSVMQESLKKLVSDEDVVTVLLSHRPELFDVYVENKIDLVLTGHAHGGQFRLPFVGGVIAPNQGFFPEYDAGMFEKEETSMVVSTGVGNSIIPLRFNNRPEVVLIEFNSR